ncbi:MAG: dephospho-CoA kinase [Chloroflexota bacterium]|nr:dephospho-CoA kinase [Chloroflexota bacterium]
MIIVGLTGSIASGKSTVAEMFKDLGAYLIDWDVLAREIVEPQKGAWQGIVDYFGREVLNDDLTLNRPKLGEIVFGDEEKVKKLDEITHPAIFKEDQRIANEIRDSDPNAVVIKDIPLLGESNSPLTEIGFDIIVDKVVVVYVSEEGQMKRMIDRGFQPEDAMKRIRSQMPLDEKVKLADFVIQNDGSLEETRAQVEKIYEMLSHLKT